VIFGTQNLLKTHAINGHKASHLIAGPVHENKFSTGHKGLNAVNLDGHKGPRSMLDRYPTSASSHAGLARLLGLTWSHSLGAAPVLGAILPSQRSQYLLKIMAGRGSRTFDPGFGAGAGPSFGQQPGSGGGNGPPHSSSCSGKRIRCVGRCWQPAIATGSWECFCFRGYC
jgi:hypothetical protein